MDRQGAQRIPDDDADSRTPDTPRTPDRAPEVPEGSADALARFDTRRAGLPDVPKGDAPRYIEANRGDRPWLNTARHAPEEVQRVFAAVDQGRGHSHIRHEGWLTAEKSQLRVLYLEDPAQLDPQKRAESKDGLLPGNKSHYCAAESSAIRDSTAFAIAFARSVEHPEVRAALETKHEPGKPAPLDVSVPLADLLGADGHRHCAGYRLVGDDPKRAVQDRHTWLQETRAGDLPSVPPPLITPVNFEGGTIQFRFKVNAGKTGYEIATMFPASPDLTA